MVGLRRLRKRILSRRPSRAPKKERVVAPVVSRVPAGYCRSRERSLDSVLFP